MDEKLKQTLKNEVQPHLIGLRNEVKNSNNILENIQEKIKNISKWKLKILNNK